MLKYLELKSGYSGNGPAWIGRVSFSKSKSTIYFDGRALKKISGQGISANYFDNVSTEEFWVSGVKKNGKDRLDSNASIMIMEDAVAEYLAFGNLTTLDSSRYKITQQTRQIDIAKFVEIENQPLK